MGWKSIELKCDTCAVEEDYLLDTISEASRKEWDCFACNGTMNRKMSCPAIRTSDSATFLDGTKREGFSELRDREAKKRDAWGRKPKL